MCDLRLFSTQTAQTKHSLTLCALALGAGARAQCSVCRRVCIATSFWRRLILCLMTLLRSGSRWSVHGLPRNMSQKRERLSLHRAGAGASTGSRRPHDTPASLSQYVLVSSFPLGPIFAYLLCTPVCSLPLMPLFVHFLLASVCSLAPSPPFVYILLICLFTSSRASVCSLSPSPCLCASS